MACRHEFEGARGRAIWCLVAVASLGLLANQGCSVAVSADISKGQLQGLSLNGSGSSGSKDSEGPKQPDDSKDPEDSKDSKDPDDSKDPKDPSGTKDSGSTGSTGSVGAQPTSCTECHDKTPKGSRPSDHPAVGGSRAKTATDTKSVLAMRTGRPPQVKVVVATQKEIAGYAVDEIALDAILKVTLFRMAPGGGSPQEVATQKASLQGLDIADYPPGYYDRGFRFDLASIDPSRRPRSGDLVYVMTKGSGGETSSDMRDLR